MSCIPLKELVRLNFLLMEAYRLFVAMGLKPMSPIARGPHPLLTTPSSLYWDRPQHTKAHACQMQTKGVALVQKQLYKQG